MRSVLRVVLPAIVLLGFALASPWAAAGTEEAPEISDPADDQEIPTAAIPLCPDSANNACTGGSLDVVAAWIDNETADTINVNIRVSVAPAAAEQYDDTWTFHATFGGTEVLAQAVTTGGQAPAGPSAAGATQSLVVDDTLLIMTVPKSAFGDVAAGDVLTSLYVDTTRELFTVGVAVGFDRAPDDDAFGSDYTFLGGQGDPVPGDTDADGLNDTFEEDYFGDLDETADGDPDGDGLNNSREYVAKTDPTKADTDGDGLTDKEELDGTPATDPTKADTDGDGFSDGAEVDAGTDPTDPDDKPDGPVPTPPTNVTPTTTPTAPTTPTTPGGDDEPTCTDDTDAMVDCIKDEQSYAAISAAGMGAVILLGLIALLGRWRL